jgi:hypothetical protein
MILPNLRHRLTADDHELVLALLADRRPRQRERFERQLAEGGPDALLDHPELPARLRDAPGYGAPSAPLFIYVAVRHTLRNSGIDDRPLSDYLAALILEFGFRGRAERIACHDDQQYRYLADIVADAETSGGRRAFLLHAHLGNFSLWLAGIFPDHITARRVRKGAPSFSYYDELGARGFRLASGDRHAAQHDVAEIYARAAKLFSRIRVALNRLSDQGLFGHISSPDRLMRQVADDFRFPPNTPLS